MPSEVVFDQLLLATSNDTANGGSTSVEVKSRVFEVVAGSLLTLELQILQVFGAENVHASCWTFVSTDTGEFMDGGITITPTPQEGVYQVSGGVIASRLQFRVLLEQDASVSETGPGAALVRVLFAWKPLEEVFEDD